jgi:hypothetical protein
MATAPRTMSVIPGYPSLSDQARGVLKFLWRKSHVKDNWAKGGEISDAWDRWSIFPWYMYPRYDLEWSTRVAAKIAQEIPAWREGCAEIIDLMLQRNTQYAAWFDLVEQKGFDPNRGHYPYDYYDKNMPPGWAGVYNAPGYYGNGLATKVPPKEARRTSPYTQPHSPAVGRTYNPDPIYGNGGSYMMGKGYLLNIIALYEFVCGSTKYDEPIELVYDDTIKFKYTQLEMAKVLYDQFTAPVDEGGSDLTPGIDCEVGKVFPWCVGVGGLGMKMTDKIHNTNLQTGYYRWLDWAKKNLVGGAKGPDEPYEWASIYYDRDIPYNMNGPKHQIPGNWFCCAYQYWPDDQTLARRLYAGAKKKFMVKEPDGSAHINFPAELGSGEDLVGFGAAAACAWEFGDLDTHAQLMTWANNRYQPTAKDGEFYYQFGLDEPWPRGWPNDWLLMSVAGGQGSWYRLYNEPNLKKFHQPTLHGVDYPTVSVAQACYDEGLAALMVAISPGEDTKVGSNTTFKVTNLPGAERKVLQDGAPFGGWKAIGDGEIEVTTTVDRHTFVIR